MKDSTQAIKETDADVVIMTDVAFGKTYDEKIKMAEFIQELCASGKSVHVIPMKDRA